MTQNFPQEEKFGIINQIWRASFSIANNLAEGNSRNSNKDKIRFIEISFGSLMEVLNILLISEELGLISKEEIRKFRKQINELGNKMNSFKNKINQ